jgi:hypothetical protein
VLGAVVASLVINLVALPLLVQRALDLRVLRLVRSAWGRPFLAVILQLLVIELIRGNGRPETWVQLIAQGVAASCAWALLVVGIGINAAERQRLLLQPLRRFRHREAAPEPTPAPPPSVLESNL